MRAMQDSHNDSNKKQRYELTQSKKISAKHG